MYKTNKFRLYPNQRQKEQLELMLKATRFVYNHFLSKWIESLDTTGKGLTLTDTSRELTQMKKENATSWLQQSDSTALQAVLQNLAHTFTAYYRYQIQLPRYKTADDWYQRFVSKQVMNNIIIRNGRIRLPKTGFVKFTQTNDLIDTIQRVVITKEATGIWYISILSMREKRYKKPKKKMIAIVPTIEGGYYLSTGRWIRNDWATPEFLSKLGAEEKKLFRLKNMCLQQSRPLEQAANYQKQKQKVARLYNKLDSQRNDFLHQLTTKLVRNYETIVIAKSNYIKSAYPIYQKRKNSESWSEFSQKLMYKAAVQHRSLYEIILPKVIREKSKKEQVKWLLYEVKDKNESLEVCRK